MTHTMPMSPITVGRPLSAFDLPAEAEQDTQMEWYGTVLVQIGSQEYEVGAVVGVPESLRATARAAGGDIIGPYLTAWYADASDWQLAPCPDGDGVPASRAQDVIAAIAAAAGRLWREISDEAAEA